VIVVTGASGHLGGLVARELAVLGEPVRLVVRDAGRAPVLDGAEVAVADFGDPDSLARALGEGDRAFMVSMHDGPDARIALHQSFVDAAVRAGVAHVVYVSCLGAGPDAIFSHARSHGATEQMLRESGLGWTSIRNGMYADDILGWFDPDGVARETGGEGRMSFSYRPELAKSVAVTLTETGHDGKVYDVVTPPPVGLAELARIATEVTGRPYSYEPAGHDEWDARWRGLGRDGWELDAGHTSYEALSAGEFDVESDDYERLTGEKPLTVAQVIERIAAG
jgi:uncharacterized protein YbjT (DUF2867 family)